MQITGNVEIDLGMSWLFER